MTQPKSADPALEPRLLRGWISRYDLAQELGLSVDTLGRWERRRKGPACVRAGRKVLYRMSVVQDWLQSQEMPRVADSKNARGRA
ncbi:helix-turn-helix domain-containing protein [uncultured Paracoccus sp.]|uniref:helix-turn-helix transcriptional regulator n=1 Tax=uncultured Paracoccus sp. TaxID=189685 RepID=UPI00261D7610|nr:helix-turn-helix domain-containing protein [uncultured Paracoccus sp.]